MPALEATIVAGRYGPALVRVKLDDVTVTVGGQVVTSSVTIGAIGAYVVVIATTVPDLVRGLTSSYLGRPDGALAASHLHLGPERQERLAQHLVPAGRVHASTAGACLLDHAAELQAALAEQTHAHVAVDVGVAAMALAAEVWGPSAPDA